MRFKVIQWARSFKPGLAVLALLALASGCAATGERAAGWVSFYWGAPEEQSWTLPDAHRQYAHWLDVWGDPQKDRRD